MSAPPQAQNQLDPHRWWTLFAVCIATFMLLLDVTIVNVALPDIQKDLHSSFEDLQWVVDAYALTLAAFLLTAGSLADRLGRKRVFIAGLGLFTLASLLCGLSKSPTALNLARALQGVGGAAMFATSLALLASAFTGRERGTALGIWGATTGAAVAVGPLVGGVLTENVSWQSIFFVNLPVGIAAIAITVRMVRESRSPNPDPIDWAGLVTFSAGLFALVFALVRGNDKGWGSTGIVALLVGAAVLLIAFVAVEAKTKRPMLDLNLFRVPTFVGASVAAFSLSASMFAMFLYLTLFMQNILTFSPLQAGLRFLPITVLSFFCAALSGNLTSRVPVRLLLGVGLGLTGLGLLLMTGLDAHSKWTALLPGFLIGGAGIGLTNPALAATAVGVVDPRRAGMASGVNSTFRQVGIATGIAGLGAVFQSTITAKVLDAVRDSHAQIPSGGKLPPAEILSQGSVKAVPAALKVPFVTGWTSALNEILVIGGIIALAGAVLALVLVRSQDFVAHGAPDAQPGASQPGAEPEAARA
jgi:EmrB/QacA subfamily drug resistance transporter